MKKGLFLSLFLASNIMANDYEIHVLKEGETLSEILAARGYRPLYGPDQWVDKTLKMNHLASPQAKELKKGFPIILPSKGENKIAATKTIFKEKVVYKTKPRAKRGFLSGLISEHQDVFLKVGHQQNSMRLPSTAVQQRENFTAGLRVQGKNNHRLGNLIYDINGGLEITSQGAITFSNSQERTARLTPTVLGYAELELNSTKIPFNFGPTFDWEERSRVFEVNNSNFETRRDQIAWYGFKINKNYQWKNAGIEVSGGIKQKFLQNIVSGTGEFDATQVFAGVQAQITNNYYLGLNLSSRSYDNINLETEQLTGFEFKYLIQ